MAIAEHTMAADRVHSPACPGCGSAHVHATLARSAFWHEERLVVVEGIPALVCRHCGEQFYDDDVAIGLDLLRGSGFPPEVAVSALQVLVYDFDHRPAAQKAS